MNDARQAPIQDRQEIRAGVWPALSTMAGIDGSVNAQIDALSRTNALTAQIFVIVASNYVDETCLDWMRENLGEKEFVRADSGWSAIVHPFCVFLAGPHERAEEKLVKAEIDLSQIGQVKVWINAVGHYKRPEIIKFDIDRKPVWPDNIKSVRWPPQVDEEDLEDETEKENEHR